MLNLLAGGSLLDFRCPECQYLIRSTPPSDHRHAPGAWANLKLVWLGCSMCQLSAPAGTGMHRYEQYQMPDYPLPLPRWET